MVNLPAVCGKCGCTFGSGFVMVGCRNSSFTGNKSQCPKCGYMASVLDGHTDSQGKLHFAKSAYNILASPSVAPNTLVKLKSIIAQQQQKEQQQEEQQSENEEVASFVEMIQSEIPELSGLKDLFVPSNAGEFYGMLSFILALIVFIQTMSFFNKQPTPTIINNYYGSDGDPEKSGYEAAHKSGALKRKSLCPCGSGKKFKNCHGS